MKDKKILTTGIGSLPDSFTDEEALNYSLSHDIPFYPQLMRLDGNMIQSARNCTYSLINEFLEQTENQRIKFQIVGPTSSGLSLDKLKENIDYISKKASSRDIIFFIDEPILEDNEDLLELLTYAKELFSLVGLHCCNEDIDSKVVNKLPIDIFSYDVLINEKLNRDLREDLTLCPGLVSTNERITKLDFDMSKVELISATCGLALAQRPPLEIKGDLDKVRNYDA